MTDPRYQVLLWVCKGFQGVPKHIAGGTHALKEAFQLMMADYDNKPPIAVMEAFLLRCALKKSGCAPFVRDLCLEAARWRPQEKRHGQEKDRQKSRIEAG